MNTQLLNVCFASFCLIGTAFSFQWRKFLHVLTSVLGELLFCIRSVKWNWNWVKRKCNRCGKCAQRSNWQNCGIWSDFFFFCLSKWTWLLLPKLPCYFPQSWCYFVELVIVNVGHFWVKTKITIDDCHFRSHFELNAFRVEEANVFMNILKNLKVIYFDKRSLYMILLAIVLMQLHLRLYSPHWFTSSIKSQWILIDIFTEFLEILFISCFKYVGISKSEIAMIQELCSRQMKTKTKIWMKRYSTLGMLILIAFNFIAKTTRCSCAIFNECWRMRLVHWISIRRCDASIAPANDN